MPDDLHVYDTGGDGTPIIWHHGTPNLGAPPVPLFRDDVRWISYDRPGYGGSAARPGRSIASAAEDVARIADELELDRFAVMGHSGGGTYALASAALLPDRVTAAVSISGLAPYGAEGIDWFAGMAPSGVASLRAATEGRAAKERHEAEATEAEPGFTPKDLAMFGGPWSWILEVVNPALAAGPAALIDDDLAYVAPWGFDPASITAPVLIVHGGSDLTVPGSHGEWLARHIPGAELWLHPGDGHLSILEHAPAALDWLVQTRVS
ncbi:alpha/beta fold hydrolase [Actinoplanes friuliensis]|uniref:Alpha/beta hydrolase fold protein n=1 Tax=Actinoplanes friuliensis DSM 7358 TaxID=1246995 RepID=U5VRM2_9ACTN|nr:alpha/beta hydrolase [Actinoplanes friuliensis]AGZ38380.1 alpha/beta hydrolase fold protein [Actinoplanes friuliensis DSM 7358]